MKLYLLIILFIFISHITYCQDSTEIFNPPLKQGDSLISTLKEYKEVYDEVTHSADGIFFMRKAFHDSFDMKSQTIIPNRKVVIYEIGFYLVIDPASFFTMYSVYYSIDKNKVLSISENK